MAAKKFVFRVDAPEGGPVVFSLTGHESGKSFSLDGLPAECLASNSFIIVKRGNETLTGALVGEHMPLVRGGKTTLAAHFSPEAPQLACSKEPQSVLLPEHFAVGDSIVVHITNEAHSFEQQLGFPSGVPNGEKIFLKEKYMPSA